MRLTLRTMLASMCGLLEPEDAKELDEKIQGSQLATKLAKRIPQLVNKRELDAPRLDAKSAYADPNSVAEYLDGLLSPERTAEFDRVCLKSDVRLAEVASCFEVLSNVHKKKLKVGRALRKRMYKIADEVGNAPTKGTPTPSQTGDTDTDRAALFEEYDDYEAPVLKPSGSSAGTLAGPPGATDSPAKSKRPEPEQVESVASDFEVEVSDEMLAQHRAEIASEHQAPAMIDMDADEVEDPPLVDMGAPPVATEPPIVGEDDEDSGDDLLSPIRIDTSGTSRAMSAGTAGDPSVVVTPKQASALDQTSPKKSSVIRIVAVAALVLFTFGIAAVMFGPFAGPRNFIAGLVDPNPESIDEEDSEFNGPVVVDNNEADDDSASADDSSKAADDTNDSGEIEAPEDIGFLDEEKMTADDDGTADDDENIAQQIVGNEDATGPPTIGPETGADENVAKGGGGITGPLTEDPLPLGKLVSANQVLARYNKDEGKWSRIAKDTLIGEAELLMSFPLNRPRIDVGDEFSILMLGAAGVQVLNPIDATTPSFAVPFGSLLIKSRSIDATVVEFDFGAVKGKLELLTPDARIALRQFNYLAPGKDPLTDTADSIVDLVCLEGRAAWSDGEESLTFEPGLALRYENGATLSPMTLTTAPYWTEEEVKGIEEMAVTAMDELVDYNVVIEDQFQAALNDSRVEVRILAGQALSLLGNHVPSVEALDEVLNKSFWADQVAWLRAVAARGPSHAQTLEETMLYVDREHGKAAFRLLNGFSDMQLQEGYAKELVDSLLSEDLMIRVLAIDNLMRITGTRLLYRPESSDRFRQRYYEKWEQQLNDGGVRYNQPAGPPSISGTREGE